MNYKQKFLEEYKTLCKKYGMYLYAESESFNFPIFIAITGRALQDDIIDEYITDIAGASNIEMK